MSVHDRSPVSSKAETLRELASALQRIREKTVQRPLPSSSEGGRVATAPAASGGLSGGCSSLLSTGLSVLDSLLPAGGLRRGTFIEWLADGPGTGVERLALSIVPQALRPGGICLLIDPQQEFFPRGAAAIGIDLDRLVVLRPRSLDDALWAAEQALRCPGVDVVFGWDELVPRGRTPDRVFRRLQLAAEEGGTLGVLLRPAAVQRQRCWGDLRVLIQPASRNAGLAQGEPSRMLTGPSTLCAQLTLLHCRGRVAGGTLKLEIDDETGALRVVSELGSAASAGGAARA